MNQQEIMLILFKEICEDIKDFDERLKAANEFAMYITTHCDEF
jgi:hypothetical protein